MSRLSGARWPAVVVFFVLGFCTKAAPAQTALETLDIVTASGTHHFSVEVMRTQAQLERGLMFRRYMPADRGMLFDFQTPQPVMMWMKDTVLSLDMVFIKKDGHVSNIAANAEPMSERVIPSAGDVLGVLEINAGVADRIGLKPGDKVDYPLFGH